MPDYRSLEHKPAKPGALSRRRITPECVQFPALTRNDIRTAQLRHMLDVLAQVQREATGPLAAKIDGIRTQLDEALQLCGTRHNTDGA